MAAESAKGEESPDLYTYVLIPASDALPLEERSADARGGFERDELKAAARAHLFAAPPPPDVAAAREQLMLEACAKAGAPAPDAAAVSRAASGARDVEITLLAAPTLATDFRSVSLYSDPDAVLKRLPPNARASALAVACGHPPESTRLFGDAFVSRCVDHEGDDVWRRESLSAAEAAPDAAWARSAGALNRAKGPADMSKFSSGGAISGLFSQMTKSAAAAGATEAAAAGLRDLEPAAPGGWRVRWREPGGGEVEVRVAVPAGTRKKALDVTMSNGALGVALKAPPAAAAADAGGAPTGPLVLRLLAEIDASESSWQVEDGEVVFSTFKRKDTGPWPTLLAAAPAS